jgi:hypothetical protein
MNRLHPACRWLPVFLAIVGAAGCGGQDAAQVRGTVMFDNQPLASGTVIFHPAAGKGAAAYSQIDAAGRYELRIGTDPWLPPGSYIATVVAHELIPPSVPSAEPTYRPITPARYANVATSELKFEVRAGRQEIPLELERD